MLMDSMNIAHIRFSVRALMRVARILAHHGIKAIFGRENQCLPDIIDSFVLIDSRYFLGNRFLPVLRRFDDIKDRIYSSRL